MCFSATACFTAGAILIPTGLYTIGQAARVNRQYLALAAFPMLFGLQQIIEGGLWLALQQRADLNIEVTALAFLLFAFFVWPFFVPLAALLIEQNRRRRTLFKILTFTGMLLGLSIYLPQLIYPGWLSVKVVQGSILYQPILIFDGIVPDLTARLVYAIIVLLPMLLSSVPTLRYFGILIFVSAALSALFFTYAYISVWCFFAAILSAYIVYIIRQEQRLSISINE